MNVQSLVSRLRRSKAGQRFLSPLWTLLRPVVRQQASILTGPMKGIRFPGGRSDFLLGVYEIEVQQAMVQYLTQGGTFYDVGAHGGYFSLLGARLTGAKGYVYSFEPLPANQEHIRNVLAVNQVMTCTLVGKAASNASGQAELWVEDGNYRPSLLKGRGDRHLRISTITLDEFVEENRWPDVIKVDVEGAEHLVLEGARKILSKDVSVTWIIEIHDAMNERTVSKILASHDYQIRMLPPDETSTKTFPRRHIVAWKDVS